MLLSERTPVRVLRRGYSSSSRLSFDSTGVSLPPRLVRERTRTTIGQIVLIGYYLLCYQVLVRVGIMLLGYYATRPTR